MARWRKSEEDELEDIQANPLDEDFLKDFLHDWENVRVRHKGQKKLIHAFFVDKTQYLFVRAGRKFAKTTTNIDIVWRFAMENPKSIIYYNFPTVALGEEILWDEKRLQTCDSKDDYMYRKYVKNVENSKFIVHFVNGSMVKMIGTWTEARGRGLQPDLQIFDEVQDCRASFIEASDSNLLAKNARAIMSGTPPKKRNHYNEWETRILNNPKGQIFKFTSYDNDKLPHGKEWLDNKKQELIKSGKEDTWIREYLAEDCFSHSDRVLPDPIFTEWEDVEKILNAISFREKIPILCIGTQGQYLCAMWGILNRKNELYILDYEVRNAIWDKSYIQFFQEDVFKVKTRSLQEMCGNKLRQLLWDPTESFKDVIMGFSECRKKPDWQERGFPLVKEMMLEKRITFSNKVAPLGLECQNLLVDETRKEFEKLYPMICTLSVLVHEYFQRERVTVVQTDIYDKYQALKDAGLPVPRRRKSSGFLFRQGDL